MRLHGLRSQIVEGSNFDPTKDQEWFLQSFNYHQSTCYMSRAVLDTGDTMACWIVCFQLGIIAISFCSLLYKGKDKNHISQTLLPCMFLGSRLSMRQTQSGGCEACNRLPCMFLGPRLSMTQIQSGGCEACSNFQVLVTQSFPILWDPRDFRPSGSSVHGILQVRILEWVAIPLSSGSSWPRDWTQVSYIAGRFFTIWATRETYL